jgi:hypothetical protein
LPLDDAKLVGDLRARRLRRHKAHRVESREIDLDANRSAQGR